jgi:hypothetical protein
VLPSGVTDGGDGQKEMQLGIEQWSEAVFLTYYRTGQQRSSVLGASGHRYLKNPE